MRSILIDFPPPLALPILSGGSTPTQQMLCLDISSYDHAIARGHVG